MVELIILGAIGSLIAAIIAAVCVWAWRRYRRRRAGESGPAPPTTRAPADSRDLLKSYPEQQDKWVGREDELGELSEAWEGCEARVFAVVGFGGQGKSALARRFTESLRRDKDDERRPVVVWWSFYLNRSADEFFDAAARHLRIPTQDTETKRRLTSERLAPEFVAKLGGGADGRRLLLVLDGLEVLQDQTTGREGRLTDAGLHALIRGALDETRPDAKHPGMILVTTRARLSDLRREDDPAFAALTLDELSVTDGAALLTEQYGLSIDAGEAKAFAEEVRGHALTLTLAGTLLNEAGARGATLDELRRFIASEEARVTDRDVTKHTHRLPGYVLRHCADGLTDEEAQFMRLLSCCVRPSSRRDIEEVFLQPIGETDAARAINDKLVGKDYSTVLIGIIRHLRALRLVDGDEEAGYDAHPLIRRHFYEEETGAAALTREQREAVHSRFFEVLPDRQKKHHPDTLPEMQPLIDAVLHGCRAGLGQRALRELLYTRIGRKDTGGPPFFLSAGLGAVETHLQLLRAFFPGGHFDADPMVSKEGPAPYLVGAAALALTNTGRPGLAVPLFKRGLRLRRRQSSWDNASMACQNLSGAFARLGRLAEALAAGEDALNEIGKLPAEHEDKRAYTIRSHGYAGWAGVLRADDETASQHFTAALELDPDDWLVSLHGGCHCTWLARTRKLEQARSRAKKNAEFCAEVGDLPSQTLMGATQALVERLAWAAGDPNRATLDEMRSFADRGVEIGRRSGDHYYLTYALLEAARCAIASAVHEPDRRAEFMQQAKRRLNEVDQRAAFGEYRIIEADAHVARAELAKLAGDQETMRKECKAAIAICDDPTCGYAWAKQDAEKLLSG